VQQLYITTTDASVCWYLQTHQYSY